jgi:hypothetical protein
MSITPTEKMFAAVLAAGIEAKSNLPKAVELPELRDAPSDLK